MKKLLLSVLVLVLLAFAAPVIAEQDIMVWNPRTPAGGSYVPDPSFWFQEALIARYGERAIQLYAAPVSNYYTTAGSAFFSGTTNYVTSDSIGTQAIIGTDFNAQSGTVTIGIGQ